MNNTEYAKRNFNSFVWHAVFLALTKNFININTVIPTMLIEAGGSSFHLEILAIHIVSGALLPIAALLQES